MDIQTLRNKSIADLKKELLELHREAFNLRMQKNVATVSKPHLIKAVRRNIARIKTILNEKAGEV
jgi:large subunit ribosomal protein L29